MTALLRRYRSLILKVTAQQFSSSEVNAGIAQDIRKKPAWRWAHYDAMGI